MKTHIKKFITPNPLKGALPQHNAHFCYTNSPFRGQGGRLPIYAILLIFLFGCNDFLTEEPQSVLVQDYFYTSPERINEGIMGCYAGLAALTQNEWLLTELRSDNTWQYSTGSSNVNRVAQTNISLFRPFASMSEVQAYWQQAFSDISNINGVLLSVKDNKYVSQEPLRAQYEGELRFLRALHYYKLTSLYGDMFAVTTQLAPAEALSLTRRPIAEIYNDIIIPDLQIAITDLPSQYSTTDAGRATKWAAEALLAQAYMMLGGSANLALAKPLLEDLMTASPHGLLPKYSDVFSTTNEMNKEIIFAVRYSRTPQGLGSSFTNLFAAENSGADVVAVGQSYGYNTPTNEIMNLFKVDSTTDQRISTCFQIYAKKATPIPYVSKFIDPNIIFASNGENDWPEIRYADVVLLYAEILAQDGGYATANQYVNQIRTRAGIDPVLAYTSPTEALDAVYAERRLELAFEDKRWFDLLRMVTSYNDPNKPMDILRTHVFVTDWDEMYSKYTSQPLPVASDFTNGKLLLPIPQYEINVNPNIPQNSAYAN